jgi:hypothetical protein
MLVSFMIMKEGHQSITKKIVTAAKEFEKYLKGQSK